jgi:ankyrin repeat protein
MAPEQFKGRAVAATDLYSLGVTLLYLLTHRSPTELPHENLKINFRSRVQVSPALAEWLEKLVAPELESRFSTAEEALTALKQSQWVNKKNWLKVGMGIAGLATVGFLGFHYRWLLLNRLGVYPVGCNTGAIETYLEQGGRLEKLVASRDSALWCGGREYASESLEEFFFDAAASGKVNVVERLLAAGAAVNVQDGDGDTPLHVAAWEENVEVVKRLLSAGAAVNIQSRYGETPLHEAAKEGHIEVVKRLLSAGAAVHIQEDINGDTPLHKAASRGHIEVVKRLLSAGAAVNVQDDQDKTPLHEAIPEYDAVRKGHVEVVKHLLSAGADVNIQNDYGDTPLYKAASGGNVEVVKRLLSVGAAINVQDDYGWTPLHVASYEGNVEVVKRLLSAGAQVNVQDKDGKTPLHQAAHEGNVDVVKRLLSAGAEVNVQEDINGWTPLHGAAYVGDVDVVKRLLSAGANPNIQDQDGEIPLDQTDDVDRTDDEEIQELLRRHSSQQ